MKIYKFKKDIKYINIKIKIYKFIKNNKNNNN